MGALEKAWAAAGASTARTLAKSFQEHKHARDDSGRFAPKGSAPVRPRIGTAERAATPAGTQLGAALGWYAGAKLAEKAKIPAGPTALMFSLGMGAAGRAAGQAAGQKHGAEIDRKRGKTSTHINPVTEEGDQGGRLVGGFTGLWAAMATAQKAKARGWRKAALVAAAGLGAGVAGEETGAFVGREVARRWNPHKEAFKLVEKMAYGEALRKGFFGKLFGSLRGAPPKATPTPPRPAVGKVRDGDGDGMIYDGTPQERSAYTSKDQYVPLPQRLSEDSFFAFSDKHYDRTNAIWHHRDAVDPAVRAERGAIFDVLSQNVPDINGDDIAIAARLHDESRLFNYSVPTRSAYAVSDYSRKGDGVVNDLLRRGVRSPGTEGEWGDAIIQGLDEGFEFATIAKPMQTYRGIRGNLARDIESLPEGGEFIDHGYTSTTAISAVAKMFAGGDSPLVVRVMLAPGEKAIPMSSMSHCPHEAEVLLPRGSKFRVVKNHGRGADGVARVDVVAITGHRAGDYLRKMLGRRSAGHPSRADRFVWRSGDIVVIGHGKRLRRADYGAAVGAVLRKREPRDGDGDGMIYDGTDKERPVGGAGQEPSSGPLDQAPSLSTVAAFAGGAALARVLGRKAAPYVRRNVAGGGLRFAPGVTGKVPDLTGAELWALARYPGGGLQQSFSANFALRQGERKFRGLQRDLTGAIDKMPLPKAITTWRGTSGDLDASSLKPGDRWSDPGFLSVSPMHSVAREYSPATKAGPGTIWKIELPKGAKAAPVEEYVPRWIGGDLGEMVLKPNQQFEVLENRMLRNGKRYVRLRAVDDVVQKLDFGVARGVALRKSASRPGWRDDHFASSIRNVNTNPTHPQALAGNYAKGHARIYGLDISIENPAGSYRRGVNPDGTTWKSQLPAHYGYVRKTLGADGDQVDVFVGPSPSASTVFVIDQIDPKTKRFDEHKAMVGFHSAFEAITIYQNAFSDGRGADRIGAVTPMTVDAFKHWLRSGDTTRPLAG